MASSSVTRQPDVAVIGAGFGGLATALTLAEQGVKVALFERLNYPGGCASTFTRRKHRFESGATLFSGFDQGQLFQRWIERHGMEVEFQTHDPIVQLRAPDFNIDIGQDRHALIRQFSDMPGAPVRGLVKFFHNQKAIADILWEVMNDERLLPPFGAKELLAHAMRTPKYTKLLPLVCKPLSKAVKSWGAGDFEPLRIYLDALCQITVQVPSHEAEAPFAMGAMDYYFRGTGHIRGGIGNLATAMVRAIENLGGEVYMTDEVKAIEPCARGWKITSRRREVEVAAVAANLLPQALDEMLPDGLAAGMTRLQKLSRRVEDGGWGAVMWYAALEPNAPSKDWAHHLELVGDANKPFIEGNHVFCSISGLDEPERAPDGRRTMTMSTHLEIGKIRDLPSSEQARVVSEIQGRMKQTLRARAPEIAEGIVMEMPASPRTFERFTSRPHGYVGGVPRTPGLHNYDGILPTPLARNLYMVGDSVFPGQSTLAVSLGGVKVAGIIAKNL
jgi:phytoene dehydrogenase-like protein